MSKNSGSSKGTGAIISKRGNVYNIIETPEIDEGYDSQSDDDLRDHHV